VFRRLEPQLTITAATANSKTACTILILFILNYFSFRRPGNYLDSLKLVNMKCFWVLLTTLVFSFTLNAQSTEDSVKAVVNTLFAGMKNADAALLKSAFAESAVLQTISRSKEGKIIVATENIDEFASFVGKLKKDSADERIQFETIKIDGPLAAVWTPYNFYLNGKFSHCGVNSFQLVRFDGVWKIQYIIDTRRRQGCKQ
jgi:hypothetical protein